MMKLCLLKQNQNSCILIGNMESGTPWGAALPRTLRERGLLVHRAALFFNMESGSQSKDWFVILPGKLISSLISLLEIMLRNMSGLSCKRHGY